MSKKRIMKVALLLEGSAGHEKQSLAIIQGLRRLVDVEVREYRIPRLTRWERLLELGRVLICPEGGSALDMTGFDLAVGTGSRTHASLIACKKKFGIPIVTCMAPDRLIRDRFDLCCVPRHDQVPEEKNIFFTDGPPVLTTGTVVNREFDKGLILVGGIDESSHYWRGVELVGFIRNIVDESPEIQWAISSSPRTPEDTVELLIAYAHSQQNVEFFNFKDTPRGWVEEQYAKSSVAWVTADSVSMIYEALTAGCRVGILPVRWKNTKNKFQRSIDYLLQKDLVKVYSPAEPSSLLSIPEQAFNEADRCAAEIIKRFGL